MFRRKIPYHLRGLLIEESRGQCAICGSKLFLQLTHIVPYSEGSEHTLDNLMVLCPTCHMGVDSSRIPAKVLQEIKRDWVEQGILGKSKVLNITDNASRTLSNTLAAFPNSLKDLHNWTAALSRSAEFDACVQSIVEKVNNIRSEDVFITDILKPLLDALGYEGVTVIHHTGRPEHGKDIVFYERDRLGGFTFYAVVACIGKIHANSSKTNDSGHYAKIIDQIEKCFKLPYTEYNLKADFHIDKVVVACSESISDDALKILRAWEDKNYRRLIFLDSSSIAGHKLRLHK